jgi:SRSO17 transposase
MEWNAKLWREHAGELAGFLTPVVKGLGRSERRTGAARYIQGLLLPGGRKSVEPLAGRLRVEAQSLQQFLADSPWESAEVWRALRREVVPSLGPAAAWIIDETGWLKQGTHSVGVSHQYCGAVGKQANCQVAVELVATDGERAAPLAGRLYLPQSWMQHPARCRAAGVPPEVVFATKPQIALALIDEALADGVARAPVLGDSVYGNGDEFRAGLRERGLEFFLQVTGSILKGWTSEVPTVRKVRRRYVAPGAPPSRTLLEIVTALPATVWHAARWKAADGSTRRTRLAWTEVFLSHGLRATNGQLEQAWLVADWPAGDPAPHALFLADLHAPPSRARCLLLARSRWQVEQLFQRVKDDLGFDHYEGRSWRGFHHHHALVAAAYLFVLSVYLRAKKNFWPDVGDDLAPDPALVAEMDRLVPLLSAKLRG